jgi:monoterpene epsilon-lactone hydrolase
MGSQDIKSVRMLLAAIRSKDQPPLAELRIRYDGISKMFALPEGMLVENIQAGDVPAERLRGRNTVPGRTVLYLHGGGYAIGSPVSHRHVAAALVEAADATLVVPDYRLAPEHRYPAALHDALAAYTWLLEHGQDPAQLIVAGDSAGGGLALALMISARNQGIRLPAAGVLISPWVDLAGTGETLETLQARDPVVQRAGLIDMARHYLGDRDPRTPLASPLYADLTGLPPLLIQVGSEEVLLDDSLRLHHKAREQGVMTTLEVWDEMIHVWHFFHPQLQEGRDAIRRVGQYISDHITHPPTSAVA